MSATGLWKGSSTAMETAGGLFFDLAAPAQAMVNWADIAHHLALLNRYVGATRVPISVASHSILVMHIAGALETADLDRVELEALLHDAHEAYLGDWSRPLKMLMAKHGVAVSEIEARVQDVIDKKAGIHPRKHQRTVKRADEIALILEARLFMRSKGEEWTWGEQLRADVARLPDMTALARRCFAMRRGIARRAFTAKLEALLEPRISK